MGELPDDKRSLLNLIKSGGAGFGKEAPQAKLNCILTEELTQQLGQLSRDIFDAKRHLGERLDQLNTVLHEGSKSATQQTEALVRWNRGLFRATVGSVTLTLGLLIVGGLQVWSAQKALEAQIKLGEQAIQVQVEPEIQMEVNPTNDGGGDVVISNNGAYPILNLLVDTDSTIFLGPPVEKNKNPIVSIQRSRPRTPGPQNDAWWKLNKLPPGDNQKHPINEVLSNALQYQKVTEDNKARGQLAGVPPKTKSPLYTLVHFRLRYQRQVDHKSYRMTKSIVLGTDGQTGKPIVLETKMMEYLIPNLREVLSKVSDEEHLYR